MLKMSINSSYPILHSPLQYILESLPINKQSIHPFLQLGLAMWCALASDIAANMTQAENWTVGTLCSWAIENSATATMGISLS